MQGMTGIFTTQRSPPGRHLYSQLLLQDFNKDFMLISKNTESCRLNIVSWLAAGAVAGEAEQRPQRHQKQQQRFCGSGSQPLSPCLSQSTESWPTVPWLHYHAVLW